MPESVDNSVDATDSSNGVLGMPGGGGGGVDPENPWGDVARGASATVPGSWWYGTEVGGRPLFMLWDKMFDYPTGKERNYFEGPGGERPNFPPERGFNAVVLDTWGYTMGPQYNPLTGATEDVPPIPGEPFFEDTPNHVAQLVINYIHTRTQDGTVVFVKLPTRELLGAFLLLRMGFTTAVATARIFSFLSQVWTGLTYTERLRWGGIYLDDEPEIGRRLPQPAAGAPAASVVPHVAGISCSENLIEGEDVTLVVDASNRPYEAEWELNGAGTPGTSSALAFATSLSSAGDYLLRVRVRNHWGWSAWFELPSASEGLQSFRIGTTSAVPSPVVTGISSYIGGAAGQVQSSLRRRDQPGTPVAGGHNQIAVLVPHVLGAFDLWNWAATGATDLGEPVPADAVSRPGARRYQLPPMPGSLPADLTGGVTVSRGGTATGSAGFVAQVAPDVVHAHPRYLSPAFMAQIAQTIYEYQRAMGMTPVRPIMTTHSACIIPDRFYARDGLPLGVPPAGCGILQTNKAGIEVVDRLPTPKEWVLPSDPPGDPMARTAMHGFDDYPLRVQFDQTSTLTPGSHAYAETTRIAAAERGIPESSVDDTMRLEVSRQVHPEDPIRSLQRFEAFRKGEVRIGRGSGALNFLRVPRIRDSAQEPTLLEGLHRSQILQGGTPTWINHASRLPVFYWCPGWGQPLNDAAGTGLNVNEDDSTDPDPVEGFDPAFRFLRKPALDAPSALEPIYTSTEARRIAWHAIASGSHGIGVFAQFWVSDTLLARVWTPIIWEITHYADLRWNRDVLSEAETAIPELVTWKTTLVDGVTLDGPTDPMPGDPQWLQPRAVILRRKVATLYTDHTQSPPAEVTRPAGQVVLFLFNRSAEPTAFAFDMDRRSETDPARGASGKTWRRYEYRTAVPGSDTTPYGRMRFDVPPYEIQIWHLED